MPDTKTTRYEIERFYPGSDRQKFWDLFVDNEGWTESDILPGEISKLEPGEGHPQGRGAVRSVRSGRITITEDVVGFRAPEFSYASRNGSLPVNDFGGELLLEDRGSSLATRGDSIPGTREQAGSSSASSARRRDPPFAGWDVPTRRATEPRAEPSAGNAARPSPTRIPNSVHHSHN